MDGNIEKDHWYEGLEPKKPIVTLVGDWTPRGVAKYSQIEVVNPNGTIFNFACEEGGKVVPLAANQDVASPEFVGALSLAQSAVYERCKQVCQEH